MATIKDVAMRSGFTVTTVSRMLNNRGYVSDAAKAKIQKAMRELNYQPNEIARSLSSRTSRTIGLIVPSASNPFFCMIIDYVERYASQHGYKLLLCNSNMQIDKEIEYFGMLDANKVSGVIVASRTQGLDKSIQNESPIISIDRVLSPKTPSICADNYQGGVLAAEHLIQKKCKMLAHISGSTVLNMDGNKRFDGFKDICEANGIPYVVLDANEEQFLSMNYKEIIQFLLDTYPKVDGIFTSNDILAAQVLQICAARKISVPEQMKIVGYDDIELCKLCCPTITTIHQPIDSICRYAVESIISRAEGAPLPRSVVFDVSLVERGTT